jgi:hypothetical protein
MPITITCLTPLFAARIGLKEQRERFKLNADGAKANWPSGHCALCCGAFEVWMLVILVGLPRREHRLPGNGQISRRRLAVY